MNATKISTLKRQLEGEKQRRHLLFCIEDHPGLSEYELAKHLKWSRGKVHYHLKILYNEGEIERKMEIYNSPKAKMKKIYFIRNWQDMVNVD